MIEPDNKKLKEAEYTKTYTLSPEQRKQLLEAKIKRVEQSQKASRKRESLCKD